MPGTSSGPRSEQRRHNLGASERNLAPVPTDFNVVVVGASAGAQDVLEAVAAELPSPRTAVIVLQHGAAPEVLVRLLSRHGKRALCAQDGLALEPNRLYVAPSALEVTLQEGILRVGAAPPGEPRSPIDVLMRSLAEERGALALGVLLSGASSDGVLGLRAIKEHGGATIVQHPGTAAQPGLLERAMRAGYVDVVAPPEQIAAELDRLAGRSSVTPAGPLLEGQMGERLLTLLESFGVNFSSYKPVVIERRLARRMALARLTSIEAYLDFLTQSASEREALFRDLLIGVTSFFRDREVFELLKSRLLPRLLHERAAPTPLRIWVPGCSTGEEAYSIALTVLEFMGDSGHVRPVQLFATDIDERALAFARRGLYPPAIEQDVSRERLRRFFVHTEAGYQICRRARELIVFGAHDLLQDPPYLHLHLISCRNLLIYLRPEAQRKALQRFHYALEPEGNLLLGSSETVVEAAQLFAAESVRLKLYGKRSAQSGLVYDFGGGLGSQQDEAQSRWQGALSPHVDGRAQEPALRGPGAPPRPDGASAPLAAKERELQALRQQLERQRQELAESAHEIASLNQELRASLTRWYPVHEELIGLLSAVSVPLLLVDLGLTLRHASRAAVDRFGVHLVGRGQPLAGVARALAEPHLEESVRRVMELQRAEELRNHEEPQRPTLRITPLLEGALVRGAWIELVPDAVRAGKPERSELLRGEV